MINNTYVVGIGGLARSGKDTLCNLLVTKFAELGVVAKRFALAYDLKITAAPIIKEMFGIDIFNCTDAEKEIVRPILVQVGKNVREASNGTHWTGILESKIAKDENVQIAIVPDIRYMHYEKDEEYWIRTKLEGMLIHVARYEFIDGQKVWSRPPNEDEAENDPKIRAAADFSLSWPKKNAHSQSEVETLLHGTYDGFLNTIVSCIYVDSQRQTRLRTNSGH